MNRFKKETGFQEGFRQNQGEMVLLPHCLHHLILLSGPLRHPLVQQVVEIHGRLGDCDTDI